jgi:hypothetical protein
MLPGAGALLHNLLNLLDKVLLTGGKFFIKMRTSLRVNSVL